MSEQPNWPVETVEQWIRYALGDLSVAEREFRYKSPVHHTICFLCQSAAEKLLKAYLIAQGWELQKTHDVVALLELSATYNAIFRRAFNAGIVLNEYITAGRYPDDISVDQIGKAEAKEALASARMIRDMVLPLLGLKGKK